MSQVIIFNNDNGGVSVLRPTDNSLSAIGINAIAKKDVPSGKPYKIIDSTELPPNWSERESWKVDELNLTDGIGWRIGAGTDWAVYDWMKNGKIHVVNESTGAKAIYDPADDTLGVYMS